MRNWSRSVAANDDQQTVAGLVAEAVVDFLEVIEVDETDRDPVRTPAGHARGNLDAVFQQDPVGQVGQRIVQRHVGDLLLVQVGLGDVAQHAADTAQLAVAAQLGDQAALRPLLGAGVVAQAHPQQGLRLFATLE